MFNQFDGRSEGEQNISRIGESTDTDTDPPCTVQDGRAIFGSIAMCPALRSLSIRYQPMEETVHYSSVPAGTDWMRSDAYKLFVNALSSFLREMGEDPSMQEPDPSSSRC